MVAVVLMAIAALTLADVSHIRDEISEMTNFDSSSDIKSITFEDGDCHSRTTTTKRKAGESPDAFCARHDASVAHDMQIYGVKGADDGGPSTTWLEWHLARNPEQKERETPWSK